VEKRLRAHYGTEAGLTVVSQPGEGTRATLRLPGSPTRRAAPAAAAMASGRR